MKVAQFTEMLFNAKPLEMKRHVPAAAARFIRMMASVNASGVFGSVWRCECFSTGATLVEIVFN